MVGSYRSRPDLAREGLQNVDQVAEGSEGVGLEALRYSSEPASVEDASKALFADVHLVSQEARRGR